LTDDPDRGDVLTFDGDDRVTITNGTAGLGDTVTISAWVNLDAGQQEAVFLSIGDEFYITLDRTNPGASMAVHASNFASNSLSSANNIAGEGWNHVAATFNDLTKELYLYLNGQLIVSTTFSFGDVDWATATSQDIIIGALSDGSNAFVGSLDDVRIFTSELSQSEITAVMGDNGFATESVGITIDAVNDAPVYTTLPPNDEAIIDNSVTGAEALTSGDIDNDGDLDLIGVTDTGRIVWYMNDGDGGYSSAIELFNDVQYDLTAVTTADLDGDGDLDIVVSNDDSGSEGGVLILSSQLIESGAPTFNMTSLDITSTRSRVTRCRRRSRATASTSTTKAATPVA
jgi:hypothetical protein